MIETQDQPHEDRPTRGNFQSMHPSKMKIETWARARPVERPASRCPTREKVVGEPMARVGCGGKVEFYIEQKNRHRMYLARRYLCRSCAEQLPESLRPIAAPAADA